LDKQLPGQVRIVADLEEGPRGPGHPPLILRKETEMTKGRKADKTSKTKPGTPLSPRP